MMHLSRFSEELVLWTSAQFQFIDLPDRFCTGSSIMPQKKNPDVPELVRGKSGRVFGALTGLLTLMKGQPLAYNKDNQEDKEPLFDAADTLRDSLRAFADMVPAIRPRREIMREAARRGFSTATDLADYLVRKGLPFRDCHEIVGHAVKYGVDSGKDLAEMSLDELRRFSEQIDADVFDVLTLEGSVNARDHIGGTAPNQVRAAVARGRRCSPSAEACDNPSSHPAGSGDTRSAALALRIPTSAADDAPPAMLPETTGAQRTPVAEASRRTSVNISMIERCGSRCRKALTR